MPAVMLRVAVTTCALAALRWHLPLAWAAVRGGGTIDPTVAALLVSFLLGVAGLPGFFAALWRGADAGDWWVRAGLVATLVSAAATMLWLGVSVREIGATLTTKTMAWYLVPPAVTVAAAIVLRVNVARVTHR